jgi:hypothetical protein
MADGVLVDDNGLVLVSDDGSVPVATIGSEDDCECCEPVPVCAGTDTDCHVIDNTCCMYGSSVANFSAAEISFSLAGVPAPDKAELQAFLTWIGFTNTVGDTWTITFDLDFFCTAWGVTFSVNWAYCVTDHPSPAPFTAFDGDVNNGFYLTWNSLTSWTLQLRAISAVTINQYIIDFTTAPTWTNGTCCGATTDSVTFRLRRGNNTPTTYSTATAVAAEVVIRNNKCCNCRGTDRGAWDAINEEWVSEGTCGPTSDGSSANCGNTTNDYDANTCPDSVIGDTTTRNMCASNQDADCAPVCRCPPGLPDTLLFTGLGVAIPLERIDVDGDPNGCSWQYLWEEGQPYDYYFSFECCTVIEEWWEEVCIDFDEFGNCIEYGEPIYHPPETICSTITEPVTRVLLTGNSCSGPCVAGVTNCWTLSFATYHPSAPTTWCFGSAVGTGDCDSPIGTYTGSNEPCIDTYCVEGQVMTIS